LQKHGVNVITESCNKIDFQCQP